MEIDNFEQLERCFGEMPRVKKISVELEKLRSDPMKLYQKKKDAKDKLNDLLSRKKWSKEEELLAIDCSIVIACARKILDHSLGSVLKTHEKEVGGIVKDYLKRTRQSEGRYVEIMNALATPPVPYLEEGNEKLKELRGREAKILMEMATLSPSHYRKIFEILPKFKVALELSIKDEQNESDELSIIKRVAEKIKDLRRFLLTSD
jgi:hypothetical protein